MLKVVILRQGGRLKLIGVVFFLMIKVGEIFFVTLTNSDVLMQELFLRNMFDIVILLYVIVSVQGIKWKDHCLLLCILNNDPSTLSRDVINNLDLYLASTGGEDPPLINSLF